MIQKKFSRILLVTCISLALGACQEKANTPANNSTSETVTNAVASDAAQNTSNTLPSAEDFVQPVADYKVYVLEELVALEASTKKFTDAIKAGNIEEAKALYAPTRLHYERVEPAAEIFGDLDPAIDAREDDFKLKAEDPDFTGFHRLEKALFGDNTTKGMEKYADKLMADVTELHNRLKNESIPVVKMVQGSADLMEEIAQTKISGEEDRYSRTDLWDFSGNLEGSIKIVQLLTPLIEKANPELLAKINQNYDEVQTTLNKYKTADGKGFEPYTALSDTDRNTMKAQINTLAEDLAQLRGTLGLD
ncbi:iron uptake system protein EfeO [Neisseria sp. Ec49-e6-T10]|uniref:iron uptake system protein EfeO n=1 Tax=Neisseria sp. Ec49-e6-T10 TaxID=3140744 RepID=UPI003EBE9F64